MMPLLSTHAIRALAVAYAIGTVATLMIYLWAIASAAKEQLNNKVRERDIARALVDAFLWPLAIVWLIRKGRKRMIDQHVEKKTVDSTRSDIEDRHG
jgi:hypothetical protein